MLHRLASLPLFLLLGACAANGVVVPYSSELLVLEKSGARLCWRDPAGGALRRACATGAGPHEVCVSADGKRAVVADYGAREAGSTLSVCDVSTGALERTIDLGAPLRPHGLAFLGKTSHVAVTAEERDQLLVVDVAQGKVLRALDAGGKKPHMVVAAPDGKTLYVTCMASGDVVKLDAQSGAVLARATPGAEPEGVALSADERELWVGLRAGGEVVAYDASNLVELGRVKVGDMPLRVEITPDCDTVVVSNAASGDLSLVSRTTRTETKRLKLAPAGGTGGSPVGVEIDPSGRYAWVALTELDQLVVVDLLGERVVARFDGGAEPDGMAWAVGSGAPRPLDALR